ncbi:THO complex subunit 6 homolog isoform X2 [Solea solea]|uniref:THO complex subunit 6 homolog isoform X2 n=1 Tax=Solea solea TaxID=90069 RepID=UPI00272C33E8|nr:THO complex subunit 6 homolog isoform X2 [Solea solea]
MGPVELLHMSVFSQSFSPCGRFLAAGNNYGEIALFSLSAALSPDATALSQKPILTFTAHEGPVFTLVSTDCQLLSAGNGEVSAWSWSELIKKNVKALWTKKPKYRSSLEIPEINSMKLQSRDNSLVIGAGDNNVHILDLEHGVFKSVLQGHSDYIHCVSVREREAEILSGGEDGAVRIWDSRTGQSVHCIEVYKYELCGGGPSLSLWHLRSLSPTSVFPLSGCQRHSIFHQDMILAVGEGPFVSHCLLGGDVKAQIPCSLQSVNTLQLNSNSTENQVLTVGGSSKHIDVFTNLSYRAFSLSF